jgi:fatty acid desaturase
MEHAPRFKLKANELMPLSVKADAPGIRRALGHLGAIAASGTALWYALGTWWAVPLTALLGYFLAFLFTALHETAHKTAFRSKWMNYALGHFSSFVILLPYEYYRAYHWDHHRFTQDLERDPELAVPLPTSRLGLAWFWTGIPTWKSRVKMLYRHAVLGQVRAPWVPERQRPTIVKEARCYVAAYAAVLAVSIATGSLAAVWLWLVPVAVGQWFLRPYLLAEHTACAHSPDMLENTRTTYTNAFIRFFAWNMPFHTEHHAYPAVPFHALPKLNAVLAAHIVNTEPGYVPATGVVVDYIVGADRAAAERKPVMERAA